MGDHDKIDGETITTARLEERRRIIEWLERQDAGLDEGWAIYYASSLRNGDDGGPEVP